jgi:FkbM family methyltransferase
VARELKGFVNGFLRRVGYELHRYPQPPPGVEARARLLAGRGVRVVVDVGANQGRWSRQARRYGYAGRIVCFEPLLEAFTALTEQEKHRVALGARDGDVELNVAANSESSSVLSMSGRHLEAAPGSRYVATELVPVRRLDNYGIDEPCYLKIDAQGAELDILGGAEETLARCEGLELELSLVELYEGQALLQDVFPYVYARGFRLISAWPGFTDRATGEVLQLNAIFAHL